MLAGLYESQLNPIVFEPFGMYYGPEIIGARINCGAKQWGIRFECMQPVKPNQNACMERFNRIVRYECAYQVFSEA